MRNSDSLFKLIRSLKKSEKVHFKKFSRSYAEGNKYNRLFDLLERANNFLNVNDEHIMKKMNYRNRNSFYVAKNYLYELILRSLCALHYDSGADDILRSRILCVKILYEKTLFSKSYELLKKIKRNAVESQNFLRLLEIIKWEKNLAIEGAVKGEKADILNTLIAREEEALKSISNISNYRLLSFKLGAFKKELPVMNKKEQNSFIKTFMSNPLLKDESKAVTLASRLTYFEIHASVNNMLEKPKLVYEARKKLISLIESNRLFKIENLTNYSISLYNFSVTCFELGYFEEMDECIIKLRETADIYNDILAANTRMLIDIGLSIHEVRRDLKLAEFQSAAKNALALYGVIKKYDDVITENEKAEGLRFSVLSLFLVKSFADAVKLINIILGFNSENIEPETLILVRLTQIMIMHEEGDYETINYNITALTRFLKKEEAEERITKKDVKLISGFLSLLRKLPDLKTLIEQTKDMLGKDPVNYKSITAEFIFNYWLHSRK